MMPIVNPTMNHLEVFVSLRLHIVSVALAGAETLSG